MSGTLVAHLLAHLSAWECMCIIRVYPRSIGRVLQVYTSDTLLLTLGYNHDKGNCCNIRCSSLDILLRLDSRAQQFLAYITALLGSGCF